MITLTAENFDRIILSLEDNTDVVPSWSFYMAMVNLKLALMNYTCQLYLGNPSDSGYINTPVDAKLIYVAKCNGNTLAFFMHRGHSNTVQFSMLSTGMEHINGKLRSTAGEMFTAAFAKRAANWVELYDQCDALLG